MAKPSGQQVAFGLPVAWNVTASRKLKGCGETVTDRNGAIIQKEGTIASCQDSKVSAYSKVVQTAAATDGDEKHT